MISQCPSRLTPFSQQLRKATSSWLAFMRLLLIANHYLPVRGLECRISNSRINLRWIVLNTQNKSFVWLSRCIEFYLFYKTSFPRFTLKKFVVLVQINEMKLILWIWKICVKALYEKHIMLFSKAYQCINRKWKLKKLK